jgi:hypothetical protein
MTASSERRRERKIFGRMMESGNIVLYYGAKVHGL